jgi:hypothetical protein
MAFVTTGNGHIVSEMLSRNKLAGLLTENGKPVNIYDDDFDDLMLSIPAEGGESALMDFIHMYEHGFEAGKRAKEWSALNMNGSGPHG